MYIMYMVYVNELPNYLSVFRFLEIFMFTRSRKGMPHLIFDSNLFRPSGKVANKYWECVQNRKTGCRARCLSINGDLKLKCMEHNHSPPVEYIQQRQQMGAVYYMHL